MDKNPISLSNEQSDDHFYKSIDRVYCPYFKDYIHFTDAGFDHIRFKNKHTVRTSKDMNMRLRLLPIAIKIIGNSHTLQNKTYRQRFENRYVNGRKETAIQQVTYYELTAMLDEIRLKIVIKQTERTEKIFLSVIPLFKQKIPPEESDIL